MKIDFSNFIFTGRGSSALYAVLKTLNYKKRKILIPINICEIIYPIILKAGYLPIFYDVNKKNGNGSLKNIQNQYSGDESVLLAVHNFGAPLEIEEISNWAKMNNIFLIEDVCNSIGASYKNKALGTWGDASIFSFGYAKIIEFGYGGAVLVKNELLKIKIKKMINSFDIYDILHKEKNDFFQEKIREVRVQNQKDKITVYSDLYQEYSNYLLYKISKEDEYKIMSELLSLQENIYRRRKIALRYRNEIISDKICHIHEVEGQIYWRYNILVADNIKERIIEELRKNKLLVSTWYPPIIEFFVDEFDKALYSGSYSFSERVINLFVDHRVSDSDVFKTIKIINSF